MGQPRDEFMASIYAALAQDNPPSFREYIEQRREELGISQRQLSEATGIPLLTLQRILNGEAKKIDVLTFLKISQFFGIRSDELTQLFVAELQSDGVGELEKARRAGYILRTFDVEGLKKIGFIRSTHDFDNIERRLRRFFGLDSIFDYNRLLHVPLFSRTRKSASDKMLQFWCSTVYHELNLVNNPNPYDPKLVRQILPKIRVMTTDESMGLLNVARSLYAAGVTVIVHSYINNTQIRGATFIVNEKPCIVLRDYMKNYATMWFALAHELYHVYWDFDRMKHLKYHLSSDAFDEEGSSSPNLFDDQLTEDLANEFAAELLLPKDKLRFITPLIDNPAMVRGYAHKWGVHEAIIYAQYMFHNKAFGKFKPVSAERAIRGLMVKSPWKEVESLNDAVQDLQLIYS